MNELHVANLTKRYPSFVLENVSFTVSEGRVTGLIGANGAGKTTTLKAVTGTVGAQGTVEFFGKPLRGNEREIKKKIGYIGGGFRYYPQKSANTVARAVSYCYSDWNQTAFENLLARYGIDGGKKISQLSEGMKVKFFLALSLSHGARLLVLDEPTTGLDPLSREEFCAEMLQLVRNEGVSVLFSTHITGDLERIADDIVLLSEGKMLAAEPLATLKSRYFYSCFATESAARAAGAIGVRRGRDCFEGLLSEKKNNGERAATLDEIIVHLETERKGGKK